MDDEGTPDLDSRVLCPDGSCIGVVGPDGCCKVCGARSVTPAPVAEPATGTAGRPPEDASADEQDDEAAPDLGDRRLCSDGACIGVIGPDGHCKACGKPYTGEPEL